MTQFWIYAVLLMLAALFLLLWPILRGRKDQAEEDRTALNIALYEEHIAELEEQHASGALSAEQLAEGRLEADRELLDDTDVGRPKQSVSLGNALPLIAALLVPIAGLGLYFHWGASDKVALTLSLAEQPKTVEDMIKRLEDTVRVQPDAVDAWYFLARTYMSEQRPKDAAHAYEKTIELVGRQPDLLGQWAQALYFADGNQWTANIQSLVDEALARDPNESTALGLVGMAAFEDKRFQDAIDAWTQLSTGLDPEDPSYDIIQTGIERARNGLAESPQSELSSSPKTDASTIELESVNDYQLQVEITISDELAAQVAATDTVFVFVRPEAGSPIPLAAKRLTVADLPAQIALTDADSLLPDLKLSSIARLKLQASISSSGDANQAQWSSESIFIDATEDTQHALLIDQKK
ncbi:c-type cytochrome biogenesis protein CcmI [Pseudomonas sp. C27(2019)]|uniref:c-type cytochrome biogenesis protein CcmI n=1 Tax=Pseudomonas sp. C27(2019) TaxID=2604941 RepID=UPI00124652B1|nr:c-type cytochrome biogenesis protein CcmI [Pseudomonas sp. C27(2019)]QEY58535.1 c-type cytochrome biogenesis protein CcmI [Pseudomonas sp. C27(2019)]